MSLISSKSLDDQITDARDELARLIACKELIDAGWTTKWYSDGGDSWEHTSFPGARFYKIETALAIHRALKTNSVDVKNATD